MMVEKVSKQITKICLHCNSSFDVFPSGAKRKYCSKVCFDTAQTTSERREIVCKRCENKFVAARDHGKWPVYCSRECFEAGFQRPVGKECLNCGAFFKTTPGGKGVNQKYCSLKCGNEGRLTGLTKTCIVCGKEFYLCKSRVAQRPQYGACSAKCQHVYQKLDSASNWKGGIYVDTGTGHRRKLIKSGNRPEPCRYRAEHRIIADKIIGRMLKRHEGILHINHKQADNRPKNLFICGSISEMANRINGKLSWPIDSNLATYK
jgi:hypothetical protein